MSKVTKLAAIAACALSVLASAAHAQGGPNIQAQGVGAHKVTIAGKSYTYFDSDRLYRESKVQVYITRATFFGTKHDDKGFYNGTLLAINDNGSIQASPIRIGRNACTGGRLLLQTQVNGVWGAARYEGDFRPNQGLVFSMPGDAVTAGYWQLYTLCMTKTGIKLPVTPRMR